MIILFVREGPEKMIMDRRTLICGKKEMEGKYIISIIFGILII